MRRSLAGWGGTAAVYGLAIVLSSVRPAGSATPTSLDSYPAVYDNLEVEHQISADGSQEEHRHTSLHIQSESGAMWLGRITVPIRSRDAEVRIVSASIRSPGAAERLLDATRLEEAEAGTPGFLAYSVPDVHVGDEIVSEIRVLYRAHVQGKWWLNLAPEFDLPVRSGTWTVTLPKSVDLSTDVWNDKGHRETQPGVHVWRLTDAAVEESPKPWLGVSSFATWNEVGDWIRSLQPAGKDAAVSAEAHRLTAGKAKALALETLYARVAQGVRSREQTLGEQGYRPRPPAQTLAEGTGDAISKHVLLAAMLAAEGMQCDPVFVSAFPTLDIDFPSPGQLEGVVSWVQNGKQSAWVDASLETARAGALLPDMRGRRGLLVTARGSRIVQVPPAPAGFNTVRAVWSGTLDSKGDIEAALHVEVRGDFEAVLRSALRNEEGGAEGQLGRLLLPPFRSPAQPITHSAILELEGPLMVESKAAIPQFLQPLTQRAGANFQALNYNQDCQCGPAPTVRHDPPPLKAPFTMEEVFELKLPDDVRPILPPATYRSGAAGTVRSSTEFANGVLRLHRTVEVRSDDGPDALKFAASLQFDLARSQVFEHTGIIDVDAILKDRSDADLDSDGHEASNWDPELARVILEYATRRNPGSLYSWNNLGWAYENLGRYADAFQAYDHQIEVNPKDEWAYNGHGYLLSRLKRDGEAIGWFERQLTVTPDSQLKLRNLGHSYLELERWPEAEAHLKRALALAPDDPRVLVDLGQALSCSGDLDGGKEYFDRAIRLCPPAASDAAHSLAKCGVGLDYARDQAESALKMTQEVFDATRSLADWSEGVGAQVAIIANLDALAEVLFKSEQAGEAARLLDAAAEMGADEDLSLHIRDVQLALGNLRAAAQAHADAQQLARDRTLEPPAAIAPMVNQMTPGMDAEGWRRLEIRRRLRNAPPVTGASRQFILACTIAESGATRECTILQGDAAMQSAVLRDAALAAFPRVNWRGAPEKITRLMRLVYQPDGRMEAFEAASAAAMAQVRRLMPRAKPARATDVD